MRDFNPANGQLQEVKISACLIVQNEERFIEQCLKSIHDVVDEIVVVDGGSTDRTVEICRRYTDRVFVRPWRGAANQRNFVLSQASGEWILMLDADETASEPLRQQLKVLVNQDQWAGYGLARRNYYAPGKWTKRVYYPDYQVRLFRRAGAYWQGVIHETLRVDGPTVNTNDHYIEHHVPHHYSFATFVNHHIRHYVLPGAKGIKKCRPALFYVVYGFLRFCAIFGFLFFVRRGFLDGIVGLKAVLVRAGHDLLLYWCIGFQEHMGQIERLHQWLARRKGIGSS